MSKTDLPFLPATQSEPLASAPPNCAVSPGSASGGPRLRCTEKWANGFYGTYRGHQVAIERDGRNEPWTFLVVCPDGTRAADGVMRERTTMREAIIYALRGALLWPNTEASNTGLSQPTE